MALAERELTSPAQDAEQDFTPHSYRWTTEQFYEMGEMGLFEGQRAILIEGEILARPPIKPPHQTGVSLAAEAVRSAFGAGFFVREQGPFDVGETTDPEPDIAVIFGGIRDYVGIHPSHAALIVEVSDSTLSYDRYEKASLYAKARIQDYWIIHVRARHLEVHRQPVPDETQPFGHIYQERKIYASGEVVLPLNAPNPVAVSALLP